MEETLELLNKIEHELDGIKFRGNDRDNCTAALLSASIEHGTSVLELIGMGRISSAYALVRPMFEFFTRGTWIKHCATDEQVEKIIKKDNFPKTFQEMLGEIETAQGWVSTLSEMWKRAKNALHSYTHGGMQLIARRLNDGEILHKPSLEEIDDLATAVVMIASLSFSGIVELSGTTEKDDFLKELYDEISKTHIPAK